MPFPVTGDPAPWFTLPSTVNPNFHFNTVGGYRVILFFFGTAALDQMNEALRGFGVRQKDFERCDVPLFGVSIDPDDMHLNRPTELAPGFKFFWDFDKQVSQQYGVCSLAQNDTESNLSYTPTTFVLDENLRVLRVFPVDDPARHAEQVLDFVKSLPPFEQPRLITATAPVLFIPNVLDRDFCQELIALYEASGGRDSGFMREIDGKTTEVFDYEFKKRRDFFIEDPKLQEKLSRFILRRVRPEIEKAFQFQICRFERYLVACYEATSQGFFNRHRDNTTKGTAHRRFAMTLNLNTGSYEGGCLRFPEYGPHLYRPGTGEALIFSCSLLHEATPVTSGRRFALLSFFYNDEDAKLRQQNQKYVALNNIPDKQKPESDRAGTAKAKLGFQTQRNKKRR